MNKPLLVSFIGFPGSGKTHFATQLAKKLQGISFNSDAVRLAMFGSLENIEQIRKTDRSRLYSDVFGAMNYMTTQALQSGYSVVYDAQMAKREDRKRLEKLALDCGAVFVLVWIQTDPEVAKQRGQTRQQRSDSHQYSPEKMEMLVERFATTTEPPEESETSIVIDGEESFEQQYEQLSKALKKIL